MALPIGELVKALVATMRERRRAMVVFIFFDIANRLCVNDMYTATFVMQLFCVDITSRNNLNLCVSLVVATMY